jgi:hypothetical protein
MTCITVQWQQTRFSSAVNVDGAAVKRSQEGPAGILACHCRKQQRNQTVQFPLSSRHTSAEHRDDRHTESHHGDLGSVPGAHDNCGCVAAGLSLRNDSSVIGSGHGSGTSVPDSRWLPQLQSLAGHLLSEITPRFPLRFHAITTNSAD